MNSLMQEILYLEVPTPHLDKVRSWLQKTWQPSNANKLITPDGIRLQFSSTYSEELSIFVWQLQRTTYLKIFLWNSGEQKKRLPKNVISRLKELLVKDIQTAFPPNYPAPPKIDLTKQSIFEALETDYPQTVKYFQKFPNGEYDLNRVYWWEQRWRESVNNPQTPKEVIFRKNEPLETELDYDLIYIGGALGVIHAAVMAEKGYRVLLIERLPFGRMNREWNISRDEFQSLINLGLFTSAEFEHIIAAEYVDGFNKFFDANNPEHLKANVLHTPKVLNIAIASEKLLEFCGDKLLAAGGTIWDETEFIKADIAENGISLDLVDLSTKEQKQATGRLLMDAMGTASPIAWQLNGKRAFDSVCPTVGACTQFSWRYFARQTVNLGAISCGQW